jgi:Phage integrase family
MTAAWLKEVELLDARPVAMPTHQGPILSLGRTTAMLDPGLAATSTPEPTLHDLGHSHASMLIGLGIPVTDVQRRLGHRKPETILRIYAHRWRERDARRSRIGHQLEHLFQPKPKSAAASTRWGAQTRPLLESGPVLQPERFAHPTRSYHQCRRTCFGTPESPRFAESGATCPRAVAPTPNGAASST